MKVAVVVILLCIITVLCVILCLLHAGTTVPFSSQASKQKEYSTNIEDYDNAKMMMGLTDRGGLRIFTEYFHSARLDPNRMTSHGFTLLNLAIYNHYDEIAVFLIEQGADVNIADSGHYTPLYTAAAAGDIMLVKLLIARGAFINGDPNCDKTPIQVAAWNGRPDVHDYLASLGAVACPPDKIAGDMRFGLSEERRKQASKDYAWAQRKARVIADYYYPTDILGDILEGDDYFRAHETLSLLGQNTDYIPKGAWVKVINYDDDHYYVQAFKTLDGPVLAQGWIMGIQLFYDEYVHDAMKAGSAFSNPLRVRCETEAAEEYGITHAQLEEISLEGMEEYWMDIYPTKQQEEKWVAEGKFELGPRPHDFIERIRNGKK